MGGSDEHVLDDVVFLERRDTFPLAATVLRLVKRNWHALDIPCFRDDNRDVFFFNKVSRSYLGILILADDDFRLSSDYFFIFFFDFQGFFLDDLHALLFRVDDSLVFDDVELKLVTLVDQLLAFETREPSQPHFEDFIRLNLRELQGINQFLPGFIGILATPDDADDLVNVVKSNEQALDNMDAFLCFFQIINRALEDNVFSMIDELEEHIL